MSTRKFREETISKVRSLIIRDRNASYGEPEDNFRRIAEIWNTILELKLMPGVLLGNLDVAAMMTGMKLARMVTGPLNVDNWDDAAGYSLIGGSLVRSGELDGLEQPGTADPALSHRAIQLGWNIIDLELSLREFEAQTFPCTTAQTSATHLSREAIELAYKPTDRLEMADVFILLLSVLRHNGHTLEDLMTYTWTKLSINRQRMWGKPDEAGVVEHVRSPESPTTPPSVSESEQESTEKPKNGLSGGPSCTDSTTLSSEGQS